MPNNLYTAKKDCSLVVKAINNALKIIDGRLVDHGDRVAHIACSICEKANLPLDKKTLFLLCVFHDIGAYKTEEINHMLNFETGDVQNHSVYGYLFLKYLTPLSKYSKAILYHHIKWDDVEADDECKAYAGLIFLADRLDIAIENGMTLLDNTLNNSEKNFCDEYVEILKDCINDGLIDEIKNGSYSIKNFNRQKNYYISSEEEIRFLQMIAYSIDFRSECTVTHTVTTQQIAINIGKHFKLPKKDIDDINLGALLHDVGKISIPLKILDFPGKLSDEDMAVMRTHVDKTDELINGIVSEEVRLIAVRHHEKLDGSGYPLGIKAENLNINQRIVAVADIVSALGSRRSYKEPFPMEKIISILRFMQGKQLDSDICDYVCDNCEKIIEMAYSDRSTMIKKYNCVISEYRDIIGNNNI